MKRTALMFLATLGAIAHAEDAVPFNEKGSQWGTPMRIVIPDYPKDALAAGRAGYVDVSGVVDGLRTLGDVQLNPDAPGNADMAEAIRDVLPYWEFVPPTGEDCAPTPVRVANRVWFEAKDGKPHVSVTRAKPLEPKATGLEKYTATVQPEPNYPSWAVRNGVGAVVYARVDIAPDGQVIRATARAFTPRREAIRDFEAEVVRTLKRWKYPALPSGETEVRAVCREFNFHVKG